MLGSLHYVKNRRVLKKIWPTKYLNAHAVEPLGQTHACGLGFPTVCLAHDGIVNKVEMPFKLNTAEKVML
ncbi:hypothetical protein BDZ89DRAFT_63046 [Hymenopellis radicata]|nr:hypothetical protein BDZ89DRAFT_63046 [Hymenopellis radicata]